MSEPKPVNSGPEENDSGVIRVSVDPGVCGFSCSIEAWKDGAGVDFRIQSECGQIQRLAEHLGPVGVKDLFAPLTRSPFFLGAQEAKCHLACPIPSALVKTAEVVLGLALPREVRVKFLP